MADGEVRLYHCPTDENESDFFTKIHPTPKWRKLKDKIMHTVL